MGWTTLSVKGDTAAVFNQAKARFNERQDDSLPDLTTDQFVKMLLDTLEHAQNGGYSDDNGSSINEQQLAEFTADYLVAEYDLPAKVAEELR